MKWASTISGKHDLDEAVREAAEALRSELGPHRPDLVVAFVSDQHQAGYARAGGLIAGEFPQALLFGCSARSVIGGGREVEEHPGVSLTAASFRDVDVR